MANRSKYDLIKGSTTAYDDDGNAFPDLATFSINEFRATESPFIGGLDEQSTFRFDILTYAYYGTFQFYDLFSLWINDIPHISTDDNISKNIMLFSKQDIETFYINNIVDEPVS